MLYCVMIRSPLMQFLKRLTILHQSFCTSQIWWTKISWISSRSGNTGRCISCYHPTCWWLTPLLLTSLTVSILLSGLSAHVCHQDCFCMSLEYQKIKSSACERNTVYISVSVIMLKILQSDACLKYKSNTWLLLSVFTSFFLSMFVLKKVS